jgi:hypothetical protein
MNFFGHIRHGLRASGLAIGASALILLSPYPAAAQSGSVGGSIGKEDKSISGSQEPARSLPTQPSRPTSRAKSSSRASSSGGGGGAGSFDGMWTFVGVSSGDCGGSVTLAISSGKIIGQGVTGTVSPSGALNAVGAPGGVSGVSTGRLSGRTGSGSWQQSDGCSSRWTAMKQ